MPTFYYVAVANADNHKATGQIDAETVEAARRELNKIGLSVLIVSAEKPADFAEKSVDTEDTDCTKSFEFEAKDRNGKDVAGTIDAMDDVSAYGRLTDELNFQVACLYSVDATEEEQMQARTMGVASILQILADREAAVVKANKKTFKGGIQDLVRRAEDRMEGKSKGESKIINQDSDTDKSVGQDLQMDRVTTSEDEAAQGSPAVIPSLNPMKTDDQSSESFVKNSVAADSVEEAQPSDMVASQQAEKDDSTKSRKQLAQADHHSSQVNIWERVQKAFVDIREKVSAGSVSTSWSLGALLSDFTEGFWRWMGSFFGMLAFIYFGYFMLATLALRYEWGTLSELARMTVQESTLVPFLALAFLTVYLLILLRTRISHHRIIFTPLIFTFGGLLLFTAGVNFLY